MRFECKDCSADLRDDNKRANAPAAKFSAFDLKLKEDVRQPRFRSVPKHGSPAIAMSRLKIPNPQQNKATILVTDLRRKWVPIQERAVPPFSNSLTVRACGYSSNHFTKR